MKIALLVTDNREHHRKYDLTVPYFGTAPEALIQGFSTLPEVELHVITCTQQPMRSPEKLAENIWFHSLLAPKLGWLRTGYQGCIRAFRKKLKELNPEIVHGQGTERDCAISAVFSGFPNVITLHGNMRLISKLNGAPPLSFEWLAARLEGITIPRSSGVVCITNYTREAVQTLAKRTWVIPNAVDASFFDVVRTTGQKKLLLCVGNICPRKNQNALIQAMDGFNGAIDLVFVGGLSSSDAYSREFERLIKSRPWCRFEGFANREQLKHLLAQASGLLLPSLEDNCPMVVLEAMAAEVPVIAAQVGGVPDLVEDGKTGLFCDPLDQGSIRKSIEQLVTNPEFGARLAQNAKRSALERFHPSVIARKHLEIYRDILGSVANPAEA